MLARARADVHDVVRTEDGPLVVFHHDDGVTEVPEVEQGLQQPVVVALVQADRGFVQHIHHPHESGSDLGGQADPLGLAAGKGFRRTGQGQVVQSHIGEKSEAGPDFMHDLGGDLRASAFQFQGGKESERPIHRHGGDALDRVVADKHVARRPPEPAAAAGPAGAGAHVAGQFLPGRAGLGFPVAAFVIVDHALEFMLLPEVRAVPEIHEIDFFATAAVEHEILLLRRQRVERLVHAESVVVRQAGQLGEEVGAPAVPAADGPGGK